MLQYFKAVLEGDSIISGIDGYNEYKVQIREERNLENVPDNPCIDYNERKKYAHCYEKKIIKQFLRILNCTPPWMTENKNLWCDGQLQANVTDSKFNKYISLMSRISVSDVNPGECSVPCKTKMYEVKELGINKMQDGLIGMTILFAKKVKITKSVLTIDGVTLISKIGGFIGISKNFLWLIIMLLSSCAILISKCKHVNMCKSAPQTI